jgi:hypothetical protein
MDRQVTCINKTNRQDPHERISRIGGSGWRKTQAEAIAAIENKTDSFYTQVGGKRANVIVATHNGHKYIKTENDGIHPNNLLELPECA